MDHLPVSLQRVGASGLVICWNDGSELEYTAAKLRAACPCATCREKKAGEAAKSNPLALPVLSAAEAKPLSLLGMRPVGNYAYNIAFSDGHDSGIFTFDLLLSLGQPRTATS